ncbi:MAG: hypothetical protein M3336_06130 [Chloroflexota bacterium]|nr:hypothetical protein [Chloroflexota bacterium]
MVNDRAPRMGTQDYAGYLDRAAAARSAEEVQHLRTELMHRWRGDPRADDLAEVLYAHQAQLAARETTLRGEASRIQSRLHSPAQRRV